MLAIKQKLCSKRGSSMVMAMVFLMFCLLIGGSVLAAATANGSRIEHLTRGQQEFLSQRSAMTLMADMLTGEDGKELQVLITDVTVSRGTETSRTVTFSTPSVTRTFPEEELPATFLQKILFEVVVDSYPTGSADSDCSYFDWIDSNSYSFVSPSGSFHITDGISSDSLKANYSIFSTGDYTVTIDFGDESHLQLVMDGSVGAGTPNVVTIGETTTITKTTVIRWSLPVIQKGGA